MMHVSASQVEEPAFPGALGVNINLTVHQYAKVERVNKRLLVPTYYDFVLGLDHGTKVKAAIGLSVRELAERFRDAIRSGEMRH